MTNRHCHSSFLAGWFAAALITLLPVTAPANSVDRLLASVAEPVIAIEQNGNHLVLRSGARVNLYALEMPVLADAGESARRRAFFKNSIKGQKLRLDQDAFRAIKLARNRYGDYLGRVLLGNIWLQEYLLAQGWARLNGVYPYPVDLLKALRQVETLARKARRGLWREKEYRLLRAADMSLADRRFHLVEGRVAKVATTRNRIYINFGTDWRRDFTAAIDNRHRRRFRELGISLQELAGRNIRVRGWVRPYNGPYMELESWTQIELLGQ